MEVSAAMYLAPQIVKREALAAGDMTDLTYGFRNQMRRYGVTVPYRFDAYTRNAVTAYAGIDRTISPHWQVRAGIAGEIAQITRNGITM